MAGASGFLGTALRIRLAQEGHDVVRLVRREPGVGTEAQWDPDGGSLAPRLLDEVDAVVNLCGVGIADRPLTARRKKLVRSSRINPTQTLARALAERQARMGSAPVLVQASATGYYPTDGTDQAMTETNASGQSWISESSRSGRRPPGLQPMPAYAWCGLGPVRCWTRPAACSR